MVKKSWHQTYYKSIAAVLMLSAIWALPGHSGAMMVAELDFTNGSVVLLKNGNPTALSGNFTQNGQIVMGQYQPLPNIIPPVPLGPYTFSLFTSGPNPVPTNSTSGSTITADPNALLAKVIGHSLLTTSILALKFILNGTAELAPVPLPVAALLFLSGLSGLALVGK